MVINSKKTKEMILDTADKSSPPLLTISNNPVQKVTCFKLLGINRCFFCICIVCNSQFEFVLIVRAAVSSLLSVLHIVILYFTVNL